MHTHVSACFLLHAGPDGVTNSPALLSEFQQTKLSTNRKKKSSEVLIQSLQQGDVGCRARASMQKGVLGCLSSLAGFRNAVTMVTIGRWVTALPKAKTYRREVSFQKDRAYKRWVF